MQRRVLSILFLVLGVLAVLAEAAPAMAAAHTYYMPWISNSGSQWSGVAFTNLSTSAAASVRVAAFKADGASISDQTMSVPKQGQKVMTIGGGAKADGWVVIESDQELGGLCFVGSGSSWVYDVPFSETRSQYWVVPHSAEDGVWKSFLMLCNSKVGEIKATVEFRDPSGKSLYTKQVTIAGGHTVKVGVADVCGGSKQASGSIWVASDSLPFSVFCLYSSLETGGRSIAGINAVPVSAFTSGGGGGGGGGGTTDTYTAKLLGSWHFWYTIISTWHDYYTLDTIDMDKNSDGFPFVLGKEDTTGIRAVIASWYPSIGKFALLDAVGSVIYQYYEFTTDGQTITGGYYWQVDPDTLKIISNGYKLYGSKTKSGERRIENYGEKDIVPFDGGILPDDTHDYASESSRSAETQGRLDELLTHLGY